MRKKIVAGNWKMNLEYAQAMALVDSVLQQTEDSIRTQIILAPPFPYLSTIEIQTKPRTNVFVAAQNCSDRKSGALTGEVSAGMLASIGVDCVIIGHSERRTIYGEKEDVLTEKVKRAVENDLQPIFCCGETLEQRKSGKQSEVVERQILDGLFHLDATNLSGCIIAYEPVWAIGTGVNAKPEEAQEMHKFIRSLIEKKYGAKLSDDFSILYGGSVTAENASGIFACRDVDGGLVGGASLKAADFIAIINAMESAA